MKGHFKVVFGILLVIVGALGVLSNMDLINFNIWSMWAYIYFGIGVLFEIAYFTGRRKSGGLLIVAGIFMVIGAVFILCTLYSWRLMVDLWPLFIVAPGFGFLQAYFIHDRSVGFLIPAGVLMFIGITFMNYTVFGWDQNMVLSVTIVLIGLAILMKPSRKRKIPTTTQSEVDQNKTESFVEEAHEQANMEVEDQVDPQEAEYSGESY